MESICYDESPWKEAKEEMDFLYKWYKETKPQREEEIDVLLSTWHEHYVAWFEPDAEHKNWSIFKNAESKYAAYLSNMLHEEEQKFEQEKEDALIRLIKIRNYLWTKKRKNLILLFLILKLML